MTTLPITSVTTTIPSLPKREMHDVDTKTPEFARASLERAAQAEPVVVASDYVEAYETFWALGQDWWKQLYDGKQHKYGPEVFDKGLHGGAVEPGYYHDALHACRWVSDEDQLLAPPTVEMYKHIHKIACQHFDGKSTCVAADKVGEFFAVKNKQCPAGPLHFFEASPDYVEIETKYWQSKSTLLFEREIEAVCKDPDRPIGWVLSASFKGLSKEQMLKNLNESRTWYANFMKHCDDKRDQLNLYIEQRSQALGLSQEMAKFWSNDVLYYKCSTEEIHKTAAVLFAEYNKNMEKATSKEEKLRLIADLFQMLEWLHPFPDGQGRTDLILLMKELCRHGFTPAILDQPYVSTFCTLDEWVDYLKRGMEKWQKLAAQKTSERMYIPV